MKGIIERKIGEDFALIHFNGQSVCILDENGQQVWQLLKELNFDFQELKKRVDLPETDKADFEIFLGQLAEFVNGKISSNLGTSLHHFFMQKDAPLVVGLEINQRCQMKCRHCYNAHNLPGADLPVSIVEALAEDLAILGTPFVIITGGEPLLHPEFLKICKVLALQGIAVKVFTNGFAMTEEIAQALAEMNIFLVGFTLFGHSQEDHEYISQIPGSFDRIVNAAKLVLKYKLNADVTFFLMKHNFAKRQEMFSWARQELGIEPFFSFSLTPRESGSLNPLELEISQKQKIEFFKEHNIKYDPIIYSTDNMVPCTAGKTLCSVKYNGIVTPCVSLLHPVGDLRERRFIDVWHNSLELKKFKGLRLSNIEGCNNCPKSKYCLRCYVSASILNQTFGKDPHACAISEAFKTASERRNGES